MPSRGFEIGDFDKVGGVPAYAQRELEAGTDALAATAAYAQNPDVLSGVSTGDSGEALVDPDAAGTVGQTADAVADSGGLSWLGFEDLAEDASSSANAHGRSDHVAPEETGRSATVVENTDTGTAGPADADKTPRQQEGDLGQAQGAEGTDDGEATGKSATDAAEGHSNEAGDTDDNTARILAEALGIDVEEARGLVDEALADEHPETADEPDESDTGTEHTEPVQDAAASDEQAGKEADEAPSPRDKVVSVLRSFRSGAGRITAREATAFAEGARTMGEDLREWFAGRHERRNANALSKARRELAKGHKEWERFGQKVSSRTDAPRRNDNR